MTLLVQVKATIRGGATTVELPGLIIRRLERLEQPAHPDNEIHHYQVTDPASGRTARFEHRYGDGHLICVGRAIVAILDSAPQPRSTR